MLQPLLQVRLLARLEEHQLVGTCPVARTPEVVERPGGGVQVQRKLPLSFQRAAQGLEVRRTTRRSAWPEKGDDARAGLTPALFHPAPRAGSRGTGRGLSRTGKSLGKGAAGPRGGQLLVVGCHRHLGDRSYPRDLRSRCGATCRGPCSRRRDARPPDGRRLFSWHDFLRSRGASRAVKDRYSLTTTAPAGRYEHTRDDTRRAARAPC